MENRSFLNLIEQQLMILVFAVAAAICIKTFVYSDMISRDTETRDRAVEAAQNVAECIKNSSGDIALAASVLGGTEDGDDWVIMFDENWQEVTSDGEYTVRVSAEKRTGLYTAGRITVTDGDDTVFSMPVSWQEEGRE